MNLRRLIISTSLVLGVSVATLSISGNVFADPVPLDSQTSGELGTTIPFVEGETINFPVVSNAVAGREVSAAYNPITGDITVHIGDGQSADTGVLVVGFQSSDGLLGENFVVDSSGAIESLPNPSETPAGSNGDKLAYFSLSTCQGGPMCFPASCRQI